MSRLTEKQANVVYRNARHLGLNYAEERLLHRMYQVDLTTEECSNLISNIFNYLRRPMEDYVGRETYRERIYDLIKKYQAELTKAN